MNHSLTVVVAGVTPQLTETLESLAWAAGENVEVVITWTGCGAVPEAARQIGGRVLELLPIGTSYARNRGLAAASSDVVVFVDEGTTVDRALAHHASALDETAAALPGGFAFSRERLRAVGGFDHALEGPASIRDALRRALGSRPLPLDELARRRARGARSPMALLEYAPPAIQPMLDFARLEPLPAAHRTKTHYLFAAPDAVLHVHVGVRERLVRSLAEREAIRRNVDDGGIPQLLAAEPSRDAVWVVEELVDGSPPRPANAAHWFPRVAEWLVALAGPPGPPLVDDEHWQAHVDAALAAVAPERRDVARAAFGRVGEAPARHMHGDLQPRNVLIGPGGVGAIDWEGAWFRGIPGLDLVYLGLVARGGGPKAAAIHCLFEGRNPPDLEVLGLFERLGVDPALRRDALLVMLATWVLGERRRGERLGAPAPTATPFADLLASVGRELG